ncbi:MAG: DEAD/DEAH box helicase [Arenibacter latericius]|nr:DEAD/DEAH box helicase [Arenibacter latericius]
MNFKELKLNKPLLRAVAEKHYNVPTPVQEKAIPLILEGKDVIVSAQTGTGKTAAYALPTLQLLFNNQEGTKKGKKIKALIVSPTRELAIQIQESFKDYGKYSDLVSTVVYGGTAMEPQIAELKKGVDILVATPGRLLDLHKQGLVNLDYVRTLVLDEADLMLDMGFIDDVNKIERLCPSGKQTLLFSATIPYKVVQLANSILKDPTEVAITPTSLAAARVHQLLYYTPKSKKIELCLHLLENTIKGNILIFRRTKFGVDKLEQRLLDNNYKVETLHGDMSQIDRQEALKRFKNKEVNIFIATDVAARGIDIDHLDNVLNFDLPNIPETYVHRIGRTGRAGQSGTSYSFCSAEEKEYLISIQKLMQKHIDVVEDNPFPLAPNAKPEVHKRKGSKHRKGRKSIASKKKKKRWY